MIFINLRTASDPNLIANLGAVSFSNILNRSFILRTSLQVSLGCTALGAAYYIVTTNGRFRSCLCRSNILRTGIQMPFGLVAFRAAYRISADGRTGSDGRFRNHSRSRGRLRGFIGSFRSQRSYNIKGAVICMCVRSAAFLASFHCFSRGGCFYHNVIGSLSGKCTDRAICQYQEAEEQG